MRDCRVVQLGKMNWAGAWELQQELVAARKRDDVPDSLLLVEHPHTITVGRNGRSENLLASAEVMERSGIHFHLTDRGGDVTYHGPGQLVGYPILDLREWKRDVGAYVRALEQVIIDTLAKFGVTGGRIAGLTGVWVGDAKVAAIGVHLSRWVTSHGFALNVATDLDYFRYIVPCGLTRPVTSMARLGCAASLGSVAQVLVAEFGRVLDCHMIESEAPAAALATVESEYLTL